MHGHHPPDGAVPGRPWQPSGRRRAQHGDPAPLSRRAAAWAIDFGLIVTVGVLIAWMTYERIVGYLQTTTLWDTGISAYHLITSGGSIAGVTEGVVSDAWDHTILLIAEGILLTVLAQFVYQFGALAWKGRTPGKAALGLQVWSHDASGTPRLGLGKARAALRAGATTAAETLVYGLALILLISWNLALAVLCWVLSLLVFGGNLIPMAVARHRRTVTDRLSGTIVVRSIVFPRVAAAIPRRPEPSAFPQQLPPMRAPKQLKPMKAPRQLPQIEAPRPVVHPWTSDGAAHPVPPRQLPDRSAES